MNNHERLSPRAAAAAERVALTPDCRNPFRMLLVRGVETIYALEEAIRVISVYRPPAEPYVALPQRAGEGHAVQRPRAAFSTIATRSARTG